MRKIKWISVIRIVCISLIFVYIFRSYLFASYVVNGKSMEPTLHDGNLLMVNKVIYDVTAIDRFDVIVFRANEQEDYVKRVIGKPGDHIKYRNDVLYLNGTEVEESYLKPFRKKYATPLTEDFTLQEVTGETEVPEGKLFVLGDHRKRSYDSRDIGFVDRETVIGKVDIRYWPISELNFQFIQ
ncbi:signal peptidase I [Gracilibacillus halophilus YIM-C55.5]|uniref:Signal peptidase I n=1 Tax=Gracilibacillus halophilus YIM-C55.5 TaxID=1308866 RepID=N4W8V0_9BACI|nr:signal peptidase I [Gracilibacillus halophilus]ENH95649.1 signal peptidase I [Gracilibacillus halophilus YIM-C55.5]